MFVFVFVILLLVLPAHATELFETHSNARAMGMGGAFVTLVEDDESLWYNPAGIANNGGVYWTIVDPRVGLSDPTVLTTLTNLTDPLLFASTLDTLYGEPIWLGASAKTAFMAPYFAAAYYYDVDASILVDNPVSPTLETNYITDTGYAFGMGFGFGSVMQMGFAAKYVQRTGVRKTWGTQTIADIVAGNSSPNVIFDSFSAAQGVGYAFDYGLNLTAPTPVQPTLSFVWKNIGNTRFRPSLGSQAPPTEIQDMVVGGSLKLDFPIVNITPTFEVRQIDNADAQIGQKLHMGVEIGLPLIDIRAGLYQGYYSYGVGLNLGVLQIDAATWGTELGGYQGQLESRRYMVQATIRMGFDFGAAPGGKPSKSGSSAGTSGGSNSDGFLGKFFGPKKPKMRR